MAIQIVIADDHPLIRTGIRTELNRYAEFKVVAEALNGDECLQLVESHHVDVLLLDVNMPGKRAIDVVRELKAQPDSCHILVLSAYSDTATVIGMLKAGVNGYVLKDDEPTAVPVAIRAVMRGETWLSPNLPENLLSLVQTTQRGSISENELTKREREVLRFVAAGNTNREIATTLQMAERTVEYHMGNILRKLGVKGRLEAVMRAMERELF